MGTKSTWGVPVGVAFLVAGVAITLAIWSTVSTLNQKGAVNYYSTASELRFSENSKDEDVKGSVIPASCQSYPTFGVIHSSSDVGGHCTNTCPAGTYATRLTMRMCQYYYYEGGGENAGGVSYLYYSIAPSQSCPSTFPGQPNYTFMGMIDPYGSSYVCQKTCANGTVITPHLGETCTPAVNLFFN